MITLVEENAILNGTNNALTTTDKNIDIWIVVFGVLIAVVILAGIFAAVIVILFLIHVCFYLLKSPKSFLIVEIKFAVNLAENKCMCKSFSGKEGRQSRRVSILNYHYEFYLRIHSIPKVCN